MNKYSLVKLINGFRAQVSSIFARNQEYFLLYFHHFLNFKWKFVLKSILNIESKINLDG